MKRTIITFTLFISAFSMAYAQFALDALYFSQNYYGGTARFTAMGGAFTALGGDFSSISLNPAGTGVFLNDEIMITPAVTYNVSDATYLGTKTKDAYATFGLDNIGLVFNVFDNDDVRLNFGFGYNKQNQSASRYAANGISTGHTRNDLGEIILGSVTSSIADGAYGIPSSDLEQSGDDPYFLPNTNWTAVLGWKTMLISNDPFTGTNYEYIGAADDVDMGDGDIFLQWPVRQSYHTESKGHTGEYVLTMGGNVSDRFYFGLNVGIQNVTYSYYQSLSEEKANNNHLFTTGFRRMTYKSLSETYGAGCNIKLGVIWRPVGGLRWGAYFHTPTWLYLTNDYSAQMTAAYDAIPGHPAESFNESTPLNTYKYRVNTPLKWGTGLAYVLGSSAIISVDYEGLDYSSLRMLELNGSRYVQLHDENDFARHNFGLVTNLRAGAEYRLNALSFRLGYAYYGSPVKNNNSYVRNYFSFGLGYRTGVFYIDGAYSFSPNNEAAYTTYDNSPLMNTNSFIGKINVTLGLRF